MAATNPGNIGHAWVKSYFIDIAPSETVYERTLPSGEVVTRQFIEAKVTDQPDHAFHKDYTRWLESNTNPDLDRELLVGDGARFAG